MAAKLVYDGRGLVYEDGQWPLTTGPSTEYDPILGGSGLNEALLKRVLFGYGIDRDPESRALQAVEEGQE